MFIIYGIIHTNNEGKYLMNLIKIAIASIMLLSLSHAETNKKNDKNTTKIKKEVKQPAWMMQDEFTVSTIDDKAIQLLSTKKGFTFEGSKDKLTLLVVWDMKCKSCAKWLQDMDALGDAFGDKIKIIGLEISNTEKKKLEQLLKDKKADAKAIKKIIDKNHKNIKAFVKKNDISFPIISVLSNQGNMAFAMQTLYKFEFLKPRGKSKKGGGLPFTVVFGYQGQTAGITAGVSEQKAYKAYIGKLIKHYDSKK